MCGAGGGGVAAAHSTLATLTLITQDNIITGPNLVHHHTGWSQGFHFGQIWFNTLESGMPIGQIWFSHRAAAAATAAAAVVV